MDEPYRSILEQDFDCLYAYINNTPNSKWGLSECGRTPAQMAFHTESGIAIAIILSNHPESIKEIDWSYVDIIENLIGEYSELSICSGWNYEIEYELWAVLNNEFPAENTVRLSWPSEGVREAILEVAMQSQKWVTWGDAHSEPTVIDLREWKELYLNWHRGS